MAKWRYLAKQLHSFQAIIWRKIEGFPAKFKVVGINDIPAGSVIDQEITYSVPESERISVKAGDMIGWSHGPGVVAWIDEGSGHLAKIWYVSRSAHPTLDENQIVQFAYLQDRQYSIEVTVQATGE